MPAKGYDFAKTLCHFYRNRSAGSNNDLEFFKMISDIDLEDIKN
jgi:hypothetical protein